MNARLHRWGRPPLPKEHGVWAMILVPWLVGAMLAGFEAPAAMLGILLGALLGYVSLSSVLEYYRQAVARRDARYLRWAAVYGAGAAVAVVPVIGQQPGLLALAPLLVPVIATEWIHLRLKRERALLNGAVSIFGFSLIVFATARAASARTPTAVEIWAWAATLAFFWGSLLFVKSNLRGRRSAGLRAGCVAFHVGAPLVFYAAGAPATPFALPLLPGLLRTGLLLVRRPRPMVIGVTEIVTTFAFAATMAYVIAA